MLAYFSVNGPLKIKRLRALVKGLPFLNKIKLNQIGANRLKTD